MLFSICCGVYVVFYLVMYISTGVDSQVEEVIKENKRLELSIQQSCRQLYQAERLIDNLNETVDACQSRLKEVQSLLSTEVEKSRTLTCVLNINPDILY